MYDTEYKKLGGLLGRVWRVVCHRGSLEGRLEVAGLVKRGIEGVMVFECFSDDSNDVNLFCICSLC